MPQQLDSTVSTCSSGTRRSTCSTADMAPKAFWWQWPCSSAFFCGKACSCSFSRPASCSAARNSSNSSARAASASVSAPGQHGFEFVAQGEQTGRLQPDDRQAALDVRPQRRDGAPRLRPGLVDQPGGEERAAAAQGRAVLALVGSARTVHAVAGGLQHRQRRARVLGLEVGVEGIGEQHDFTRRLGVLRRRRRSRRNASRAPERQAALGR